MGKKKLPKKYDHPEHFKDEIEEYLSEQRSYPTPLEDLLLEQAGHRCTICRDTNYDFHHIKHLANGGKTEYDNLIVLCPNCHRRVHKEGIPNERQLRHYKLKLEVVYGLPILSRLTEKEKKFVKKMCQIEDSNELIFYNERHYKVISTADHEDARKILQKQIGLLGLRENGIISCEYGLSVTEVGGKSVGVEIFIRITPTGIRWIKYLKKSGRIGLID